MTRFLKPTLAFAALAMGLSATTSAAYAAQINGLFNTGTDANNVALTGGNGVIDPHYLMLSSTAPGFAGLQARTFQCCYFANDADSQWISMNGSGGIGGSTTVYRTTFDLTGLNPLTAVITGRGGTDNLGRIFLNGTDTGIDINGFQGLVGFTLNSGFVGGLNTLDFRVTDLGGPTAFRIDDLTGTANILTGGVPEPASWALMIAGFGLTGATMRRTQRVRFTLA